MNPEIILGPPGCGKTTALLSIVDEELARGTPPDRIAFVTFTRRAAEEAISRAVEKFKLARTAFPYFKTLHAHCYKQLGIRSGDVMNTNKLAEFGDFAGVKITGRWSEDGTLNGFELGDRILFMENLARVRMIPLRQQYDADDDNLSWGTVDYVARSYAAWKEQKGLVDFTDMLLLYIKSGIQLKLD
ncbi:MAG TPA: UvrD-helicase domain-containing protein, partial [Candidatus Saccharimonadia bacterium]|nr:UvrD-helicase domain-containing protein [Candidatus Saccharimonadia bacterium]